MWVEWKKQHPDILKTVGGDSFTPNLYFFKKKKKERKTVNRVDFRNILNRSPKHAFDGDISHFGVIWFFKKKFLLVGGTLKSEMVLEMSFSYFSILKSLLSKSRLFYWNYLKYHFTCYQCRKKIMKISQLNLNSATPSKLTKTTKRGYIRKVWWKIRKKWKPHNLEDFLCLNWFLRFQYLWQKRKAILYIWQPHWCIKM